MGGNLKGYGCAGLSFLEVDLTAYELAKGDASIATLWCAIGTCYGIYRKFWFTRAVCKMATANSKTRKNRLFCFN